MAVKVIVDTSVWSLFLRQRNRPEREVVTLKKLIREGRVQMLGIVKQELLSGVKEPTRFDKLLATLKGFPDLLANSRDHVSAASCYNTCRARGIQGSNVDFLICAQAIRHELPILSTDIDFIRYAEHLPVTLYSERFN